MFEKKTYRWVDLLPEALFSYRITVGVTKKTPFEIFYFRAPHFVYSYPGTNIGSDTDIEGYNEGERAKIQEMHFLLVQDVREQRERNSVKMKERWDTVNIQQVQVHHSYSTFLFILFPILSHALGWRFCPCRPPKPLQSSTKTNTWEPSVFSAWSSDLRKCKWKHWGLLERWE